MRTRTTYHRGLSLGLALLVLQGCDSGSTVGPTARPDVTLQGGGADASSACSAPTPIPLLAARTVDVGAVTVSNDGSTLFVRFETDGGWMLAGTALFVGASAEAIPATRAGQPMIGLFPHRTEHHAGVDAFTYAVPLASTEDALVIAAFADVASGDRREGAWADGDLFSEGGSWATWFGHTPESCASGTIGPDGGSLDFQNLALTIPPGALPGDVAITARRVDPPAGGPGGVVFVDGTAFDLGPDGLEFQVPFEIAIAYAAADLPPGVPESALRIFHVDASGAAEALPGSAAAGVAGGSGSHFSTFVVGAGDALATVDCPDLSFAAALAVPLDAVPIGTLPADWSAPLSALVTDAEGSAGQAFVRRLGDGPAVLIAPIHPGGDPDGGDVELRLTDGASACASVAFHVAPLPAAPGEFGAVVDGLQEILRQQAGLLGTTPEDLAAADVLELPVTAWPLALSQSVLDHPDNPNSLRALAQGDAPFGQGVEVEMADRLLARTGVRAALAGLRAAAASAPAGATRTAGLAAALDGTVLDCGPIADATLLDFCMTQAHSAAFRTEGVSNTVLNDLGFAVGLAGAVPHPAVKLGAAGAGLAIWTLQNYREGVANLLPSAFVELRFEASPLQFMEDDPGPGEWSNAQVIATSAGWGLDKLILDGAFQAVGAAGAYDAWLNRALDPDLAGDLAGLVQTDAVQGAINATAGSDFVEIPPQLFGPVDVSDPSWSVALISDGASIDLVSATTYEPVAVGTTVLDLRIRNEGGQFGGQTIRSVDPASIEILQIDLDIDPEETTVEPGAEIVFFVDVTNSIHPEMVEMSAKNGTIVESSYLGGGQHQVLYVAPTSTDDFPDLVTARHTATTGARGAAEATERTATAEVRTGSITISPREARIAVGDMLQFTVEVEGLSDETVTWSASLGDIDAATGAYTATAAGTATIRAVSVADPDIDDQVAIQVFEPACHWSGLVDGAPFEGAEGDIGVFQKTADGTAIESLTFDRADASASIVASFITLGAPALPVGATGTFPIIVQGDMGAEGTLGYNSFSEDGTSVQATITENDGEVLAGDIDGTVHFAEPIPDGRDGLFLMTFRITRDPLDSTDVFNRCTIGGVDGGSARAAVEAGSATAALDDR